MSEETATPEAVLLRAAELVEAGWCRVNAARDAAGWGVASVSDEAVEFCALGAVNRAVYELVPRTPSAYEVRLNLGERVKRRLTVYLNREREAEASRLGVVEWNDDVAVDGAEVAAGLRAAAR